MRLDGDGCATLDGVRLVEGELLRFVVDRCETMVRRNKAGSLVVWTYDLNGMHNGEDTLTSYATLGILAVRVGALAELPSAAPSNHVKK